MISTEEGFELDLDETDDSEDETVASNGRSYKCDLCDMSFQRRRDMSEHQYSLHTFDKLPYSCEHCIFKSVDKVRKSDWNLNKHRYLECTHVSVNAGAS